MFYVLLHGWPFYLHRTVKRSDITTKIVLCAVKEWSNLGQGNAVNLIMKRTGCPEKLAYSALERDDENGLIEYGVSIRVPWLTEKGEQLLKKFQ